MGVAQCHCMLALRAGRKNTPFARRAFYNCIGQHPMMIELITPYDDRMLDLRADKILQWVIPNAIVCWPFGLKNNTPFAQRAFYNCIEQHHMMIELITPYDDRMLDLRVNENPAMGDTQCHCMLALRAEKQHSLCPKGFL